jgi:general secretion pathway protein K
MRVKRTKTKQKGFVVVLVLSMVGLLAVLLLGFNHKSRANLLAVGDFQKSQQALNCARAGLNIAIAAVRNNEDILTNKQLANLFSEQTPLSVGEGSCSIIVTEENGKLNVNLLADKNGKPNRARIDQLLRLIDLLNQQQPDLPHIGYGIVPAIIDWTDDDDEVVCLPFIKSENLGAESDYYAGLKPPYRCRNKPFDTTQELLLLKGVTSEVFERIRDYVTVKGDGKVSINSASKLVIESLSQELNPALAQMIIDRRKIKPFDSVMELRDVPGMTDGIFYSIKDMITVSPADQYYLVTSHGNVDPVGRMSFFSNGLDHTSSTISAILKKNMQTKNVDVVLYKEL